MEASIEIAGPDLTRRTIMVSAQLKQSRNKTEMKQLENVSRLFSARLF